MRRLRTNLRPFVAVFVLLIGFRAEAAAPPAPRLDFTSASQITADGPEIANGTYSLPIVHGNWFVTPTDSHASLQLDTGMGNATRVVLDIEWDGKESTHTLTQASNHNFSATHRDGFMLTFIKGQSSGTALQPGSGESIVIDVTRMDDSALEATVRGSATINNDTPAGGGSVKINGTISLKRNAPLVEKVTGTYGSCDAKVHDKLVGAEDRSPSECEVKFDEHLRAEIIEAFTPMIGSFTGSDWTLKAPIFPGPVDAMIRGNSEKQPYKLNDADGKNVVIDLSLNPNSAEYQRRQQAYQDAIAKMAAEFKSSGTMSPQALAQTAQLGRDQAESSEIKITVDINSRGLDVTNYAAQHDVSALRGGGSSVFLPAAESPSGGGADGAQSVTWVLLGPWTAPAFAHTGPDEEKMTTSGGVSPAKPLLSVQNIWVRVVASKPLAQQVIAQIDWKPLQALLNGQ